MDVGGTTFYSTAQEMNTVAQDHQVERSAIDISWIDTISSIDFVGNRKYKDKILRQRIDLKIGDYLDPILAEAGRRTIAEIYRKIGFAFVQVTLDKQKFSEGQVIYTIDEGPRVQIRKVSFSGNDNIKTGTLRKVIKTKRKKWFYWPFHYTKETVTEDIESLENLYYERGFLDHSIAAKTEFTDDKSKVRVTFIIDEGPIYRVGKIVFAGNQYFDQQTLRAKLQLEPGQVYIKRKAESDAKRLGELYHEDGFVDAEVSQQPKFVSDANMVDVEYKIAEGNQFRIGRVDITGNEFTQDKAVRQVLDEYGFTPGQLYNASMAPKRGGGKLEEYVQRRVLAEQVIIRPVEPFLFSLGPEFQRDLDNGIISEKLRQAFEENDLRVSPDARLLVEQAGSRWLITDELKQYSIRKEERLLNIYVGPADRMDAKVDIEEGLTGMITPGVGVSSDVGFSGHLIYRQLNFDITDWPESFGEFITMQAFKGAGQSLEITLAPGTEVSMYKVDFSNPYWRDRPTRLDVGGSKLMWFRRSHDEGRLRSYLGFEQRREQHWRRSLSFRAENVDVGSIDFDAPQEIRSVKGNNNLMGIRVGMGRDLTDDVIRPTKGYTFNAGYEQVTGDHTFGIPGGTYVWYKTLYEDVLERKTVLATKLHAATTLGDAPPFEKFYAGGSYSSRGFKYRGVSTRGLQTNVLNPERKDPIGSDWIFLAN
ncbi:MAG: outer membrane protein assembly factor, partial [Phycisphaerae bacterium]